MRRHPFDPVALVFGLTFAAAAIVVLTGGSLSDDGDFLLPACLLGLGIALLVQNASRNRPPGADARALTPTPATDPSDLGDDGLYRDALDDLDAADGIASVRTPSGIEWPGPTTPAPGESTAAEAAEPASATDESGTEPLGDPDVLGSDGRPGGAQADAEDGGTTTAGKEHPSDTSPGSDDPTHRSGD